MAMLSCTGSLLSRPKGPYGKLLHTGCSILLSFGLTVTVAVAMAQTPRDHRATVVQPQISYDAHFDRENDRYKPQSLPPSIELEASNLASPNAGFDRVAGYVAQAQYENAVVSLHHLLDDNPWNSNTLNYLASIYQHHLRDTVAASEHYERVLSIDPENLFALVNLGLIRTQTNREDGAERLLARALSIDPQLMRPEMENIYNYLALVYMAKADNEKVVDALHESLRRNPNDGWAQDQLDAIATKDSKQAQPAAKRKLMPNSNQTRILDKDYPLWLPPIATNVSASDIPLAADMSVDGNSVVHLVWSVGKHLFYLNNRLETRQINGFSTPYEIHAASNNSIDSVSIAISPIDGRLVVVWREGSQIKRRDLFQSISSYGWGTVTTVAKDRKLFGPPTVSVSAHGIVHVAFAADGSVYRSSEGGKPIQIATLSTSTTDVIVRCDGHLSWVDNNVLFYLAPNAKTPSTMFTAGATQPMPSFDFDVNAKTGIAYFAIATASPGGSHQVQYMTGAQTSLVTVATLSETVNNPKINLEREPSGNVWRIHLFWSTATGTGHAATDNGQWHIVHPVKQIENMKSLVAVNRIGHTLHAFDGLHYTRTYEANLGSQDRHGTLDVEANTCVNISTGNVHHTLPVYWSDGAGIATNLDLHYNTQHDRQSLLTPGWSLLPLLTVHSANLTQQRTTIRYEDGRTTTFLAAKDGAFYADAEFGDYSILEPVAANLATGVVEKRVQMLSANAWQLTFTDGSRWLFDGVGRLTWQFTTDNKLNSLRILWTGIAGSSMTNKMVGIDERLPTKIIDSVGRHTTLSYFSGNNRLKKIAGPGGGVTEFDYQVAGGELKSVRQLVKINAGKPVWRQWIYEYDDGDLSRVTTPIGSVEKTDTKYEFSYTFDGRVIKVLQPQALHANEDGKFNTSSYRSQWIISYSGYGRTSVADPRSYVTDYEHDPSRALVLSIRSPVVSYKQQPLQFVYDNYRNLTKITLRDGSDIAFDYNATGSGKWQHVKNNIWRMTLPGTATYKWEFYNEFNQPTRHEDPLGNQWQFNYDTSGNLTAVMYPRVHVVAPQASAVTYTASGFGGSDTTGKVAANYTHIYERWTYLPDGSGRIESYTDAVGNIMEFSYDTRLGEAITGLVTGVALKNPQGRTVLSKNHMIYCERGYVHRYEPRGFEAVKIYERDKLGRTTSIFQSTRKTRFSYDDADNFTQAILPNGTVYTHKYDLLNRLTAIVDHNGIWKAKGYTAQPQRRFYYTARGELRRETDFKQNPTDFETNGLGWIEKTDLHKKDKSRITEFGYDPQGRVLTARENSKTQNRITQYRYDDRGNLTSVIFPDQSVEELLRYDLNDRMIAWGVTRGKLLILGEQIDYDALDRVVSVLRIDAKPGTNTATLDYSRAEGTLTRHYYDANGNLRAIEDPLKHIWQTTYNAANDVVDTYDARGYITLRRFYTSGGRLLVELVPDPTQSVNPASTWRPQNASYPDKNYFVPARFYLNRNDWGEPTTIMDIEARKTNIRYDTMGRVKSSTDANGGNTTYHRDHRGLITLRKQYINRKSSPGIQLGTVATEWEYDANGNVTKIYPPYEWGKKDPELYDAFEYDEEDMLTRYESMPEKATNPSSNDPLYQHTWSYNEFGDLDTYTNPRDYRTVNVYDVNGNNIQQRHEEMTTHWDAIQGKNVSHWSLRAALDTQYYHGLVPREWKETKFNESWDWGAWETEDTLTQKELNKLPCGHQTKTIRVSCIWYKENGVTKQVKTVSRWRPPAIISTEAMSYTKVDHQLDGYLRPRSILYYDNLPVPIKSRTDRVSIDYDAAGRIRTLTDLEKSVVEYTRDAEGNVWKMTRTPFMQTREDWATFQYDAHGRKTKSWYIDGSIEDRKYTKRGLTQSISVQDKQLPAKTVADIHYQYDAARNPVQIDINHLFYKRAGSATVTRKSPLRVKYQYTPVTNWLRQEELSAVDPVTKAVSDVFYSIAYQYDTLGNRIHAKGAHNGNVFKLNYDYGIGNRLDKVTWTGELGGAQFYDVTDKFDLNVLKGLSKEFYKGGSIDYQYDDNGNVTTRNRTMITRLKYGIAAKDYNSVSPGYVEQIDRTKDTFGYDFADRLARYERYRSIHHKEHIWSSPGKSKLQREYPGSRFTALKFGYTYLPFETPARFVKQDLMNKKSFVNVHALDNVIGDYERQGTNLKHQAAYVAGDDADTLVARVPGTGVPGNADIFHYDAIGSVIAVTGKNGVVKARYLYDAWGNKLAIPGTGVSADVRYGFNGREEDRESELMNYRTRQYDPWTGRFMQSDSLDPTLQHYLFVDNRPSMFVDPIGTEKSYKRSVRKRTAAKRGRRKAQSGLAIKASRKAQHAMARSIQRGRLENSRYFRQLRKNLDKVADTAEKAKALYDTASAPVTTVANNIRNKAVKRVLGTAASGGKSIVRGAKTANLPGLVSEVLTLECDTPQAFEGLYLCDIPPDWTREFVRQGFRPERIYKPASWDPFGIVSVATDKWQVIKDIASDPGIRDLVHDLFGYIPPREPVQPMVRNPCYRYVDAGMPDPSEAESSDCYDPNQTSQKMYLPKAGFQGTGGANWGTPAGGGGSDAYQQFPYAKKLPPPVPPPKKAAPSGNSGGGQMGGGPGSSSQWGVCVSWPIPIPYPCKIGTSGGGSGTSSGSGWDHEKRVWIED